MTKTISTLVLVVALFGGTVLADDGNMGGTGRTDCNVTNPPPTCQGGAGFGGVPSTGKTSADSGSEVSDIAFAFSDAALDVMDLIY